MAGLQALLGATLLAAAITIGLALQTPWSGVVYSRSDGVVLAVVPASPADAAGVRPGWRLQRVAGCGEDVVVEVSDLSEDPDELIETSKINRFFARQSAIVSCMVSEKASLYFAIDENALHSVPVAAQKRPFEQLGFLFWVQLISGIGVLLIGGWVFVMRRNSMSHILLFASAVGVAFGILPSAIYTTRELALDGEWFRLMSMSNGFGITLFASAFAGLMLVYPRKLAPAWLVVALQATPVLSLASEQLGLITDVRWSRVAVVAGGLAMATALGLVQYLKSSDALDRAAMRWVFLSLLAGLVFFAAIAVIPIAHGRSAEWSQGYILGFSLVFYSGLAVAVSRYRLFRLDDWAFRLLFYASGALLLFALDAILIHVLHMASGLAFGIALFVVGMAYLPIRSRLWRRWSGGDDITDAVDALAAAVSIAAEQLPANRSAQWRDLIRRLFNPLVLIDACGDRKGPAVDDDGLELYIPATIAGPALCLRHRSGGRALFQPRDVALIERLLKAMAEIDRGSGAYLRGAEAERLRIARDLHDDIGARLLTALHQGNEKVRPILQETLADIRTLTGALTGEIVPLGQTLAEARHEAAVRLSAVGVELDWPPAPDSAPNPPISYSRQKALSSAIRETVTNVIKHSSAGKVSVDVAYGPQCLTLFIADNGSIARVAEQQDHRSSHGGLNNIAQRIREVGGEARFDWLASGLRTTIFLPLFADAHSNDPSLPPVPGRSDP